MKNPVSKIKILICGHFTTLVILINVIILLRTRNLYGVQIFEYESNMKLSNNSICKSDFSY